jgi:cyclopropane fatty-acyl-phospholipid synthase-like methyltransferase
MNEPAIKTMKLYSQVERIHRELEAAGIAADAPLDFRDLSHFDHYHYHGAAAVQAAADGLHLSSSHRVAEVGSGIGGPARHIAGTCGCRVTALELQEDLHDLACDLTARCSLSERIEHRRANVLDEPLEEAAYDAVVSWLAIFHIPSHERLWRHVSRALKSGGRLFIEDLCSFAPFNAEEERLLSEKLYAQSLPTPEAYRDELTNAGFEIQEMTDMSTNWRDFTAARLETYRASRRGQVAIHGPDLVDALEDFYATVAQLFAGGNLGGLRIVAQKL